LMAAIIVCFGLVCRKREIKEKRLARKQSEEKGAVYASLLFLP
jgi:hypothetical protein